MVPGIVVEDDQLPVLVLFLRVFGRVPVCHGILPGHRKNPEALVELPDKGVVIIRKHRVAATLSKQLPQPVVIPHPKGYLIAFRLVVRRVKIQERPRRVIFGNNCFIAEIFDHYILQPSGTGPDQVQTPADIDGFPSIGSPAAGIAVPDHLVESGSFPHISQFRFLGQQLQKFLPLRRLEISFTQLHLLLQIIIGKLLLSQKFPQHFKLLSGIERQETNLLDQGQRTVSDAPEQIDQIAVVVVVHFLTAIWFPAKGNCRGTAKDLHQPGISVGK